MRPKVRVPSTKPCCSSSASGVLSADSQALFGSSAIFVMEAALQPYREGSADFADCLHIELATEAGEQPPRTFAKNTARLIGAQLLGIH